MRNNGWRDALCWSGCWQTVPSGSHCFQIPHLQLPPALVTALPFCSVGTDRTSMSAQPHLHHSEINLWIQQQLVCGSSGFCTTNAPKIRFGPVLCSKHLSVDPMIPWCTISKFLDFYCVQKKTVFVGFGDPFLVICKPGYPGFSWNFFLWILCYRCTESMFSDLYFGQRCCTWGMHILFSTRIFCLDSTWFRGGMHTNPEFGGRQIRDSETYSANAYPGNCAYLGQFPSWVKHMFTVTGL